MRILVTGASGYLASSYLSRADSPFILCFLSRQPIHSFAFKNDVHGYEYDGSIESIVQALEDVDIVVHLATSYIPEHQPEQINSLLEANVIFGTKLLEAMKITGVLKIVNIGTAWQRISQFTSGSTNLYAASKNAFQAILDWYVDAHSMRAVTLLLNDTFGPNDRRKKLISTLLDAAEKGQSIVLSPGYQILEFTYITDVINAFDHAIDILDNSIRSNSSVFNILTEDQYSIRELVLLVEKVTNKKLSVMWGGRPYRDREVMKLDIKESLSLPNWRKRIDTKAGIEKILRTSNVCID